MSQAGSLNNTGGGGGGSNVQTITGNSGGAVGPTGNNINLVGSGGVTVTGNPGTSTLTITSSGGSGVSSVTGTANQILASPTTGAVVLSLIGPYTPATYTAHSVLLGEGTSSISSVGPTATTGQVLQNNSGADPTYSTATYPSSTTVNQLLYSSSANVIAGLASANDGVLTTGTSGIPVITPLASDGQLIIGSGSGAPIAATLTAGTGITITNAANSITITNSGGGGSGITTIDGDTGSVTGSTVTFNGHSNAGSSVSFSGSGTTMSFKTSDSNVNTLIGVGAGNSSISGSDNTSLGHNSLNGLTSGTNNTGIGASALNILATGTDNTAVGKFALSNLNGASNNTGIGFNSLATLSTGSQNVAIGDTSLGGVATGSRNIAIGYTAGNQYNGAESSNIIIGNPGIVGESNLIKIGVQGSSTGQQSKCYIAGIESASYSTTTTQTILTYVNTVDGQVVGSAAISSDTATTAYGSLTIAAARQNTAQYAILVNVSIVVTAATGATIIMGVGSTSTPSTDTVVTTFSGTGTFSFSAIIPSKYYLLVNTTGTITVGSTTTQTCAIG